jgi:hypothetical protein
METQMNFRFKYPKNLSKRQKRVIRNTFNKHKDYFDKAISQAMIDIMTFGEAIIEMPK